MENEIEILSKKDLDKNKIIYEKKSLKKYWDKEFINEKISEISKPRDKMFCQFLWMSGVRITEAITLKKGDFNFKYCTAKIIWQKNRKNLERIIPIHPQLVNMLQIYTATMNDNDKLFPFSRIRGWQIINKYFNGHPHQMRHSFAVNWIRSNGNLSTLSSILGHADFKTTMEYLKLSPTDQGKELIKIDFI